MPKGVIAFDTETCLFRPGVMAPELVCLTYQHGVCVTGPTGLVTYPASPARIVHVNEAEPLLRAWLEDSDVLLVGHHTPYDVAVILASFPSLRSLFFAAYDSDRVTDTKVREQLLDIAGGRFQGFTHNGKWLKPKYDLSSLTRKYTGRSLLKPKDDTGADADDKWRLRFGELLDRPVAEWPEAATKYALEDTSSTLEIFFKQEEHSQYLQDQFRQARGGLALQLASVWGLRTRADGVDKLRQETEAQIETVKAQLVAAGIVRKDGSRDTKKAQALMVEACAEAGIEVPLTDGGKPALDEDACKRSEHPLLQAYARFSTLGAVLNKDVPMLAAGTVYPVHTRFGMAGSARSTSSGPNVQNPRRLPGVRECFVARKGWVYIQADYPQLELYTLAQCCYELLGYSKLGDALNAGLDPHLALAADILGIPYAEAKDRKADKDVKETRQFAKIANFGLPGGLGVDTFVEFAASSGVAIDARRAKELKDAWLTTWPEMKEYFRWINAQIDPEEKLANVEQLYTKRYRGGIRYAAACNTMFQGLGADIGKLACWLVTKAQHTEKDSPLYGSHLCNFIHDELFSEVPEGRDIHAAAYEQARLMGVAANTYLTRVPMVPAKIEPTAMRYWSKDAVAVFDSNNRLIAWSGE